MFHLFGNSLKKKEVSNSSVNPFSISEAKSLNHKMVFSSVNSLSLVFNQLFDIENYNAKEVKEKNESYCFLKNEAMSILSMIESLRSDYEMLSELERDEDLCIKLSKLAELSNKEDE